jgi:hypothetical protein
MFYAADDISAPRIAATAFLLLVHQVVRASGWTDRTGKVPTFDEAVSHLREMAVAISGESTDAPQPEIAVLDVSDFTASKAVKAPKKATKPRKKQRRAISA